VARETKARKRKVTGPRQRKILVRQCKKRRQVSVEHLLRQKKTVVSPGHHCSLPMKRPVKHFESDGSKRRAGDGARTRDSLLGRQELYH
jgi:hypothetical protein